LQLVSSPDGSIWTSLGTLSYAAANAAYIVNVPLSGLTPGNYYLGFRTGLTGAGSIYIDRIFGPEITPVLPGPAVLSVPADLAINVNEYAAFSWTPPVTGGVPAGYRVYCDTNPTPTTLVGTTTALTYTLTTPLVYNTLYYWTVEAYNAAGDAARPTPRSFTTRANPIISAFPWLVNFGTTTADLFPPLNWTRLQGLYPTPPIASTSFWYQDDWVNVTTPANKAGKVNIWSTSTNGYLVTPPIQVPAGTYELDVDLGLTIYGGTTSPAAGAQLDDRFIIFMSDSPMMTAPTILREYNNSGSPYVYDSISSTGTSIVLPLTGITGIKYFAFYGESTVSNGDNDFFVDNVQVRETPAVPVMTVAPLSWDFGTKTINTLNTKEFTITNTGGGILGITSISVAGTYYSLTVNPAPISLGAGISTSFTVQYAPLAVGTHTGTVTIVNDLARASVDIPLTAACVDPTISIFPYDMGFEDAWVGTPPAPAVGWTVINANTDTYTWRQGATYISAHTGLWFAQGMGNTNDWMITPPIDASVNLRLKWWDAVESASYPNSYRVMVSTTDNNIGSFTQIADFTCSSTTWVEHTLNLDAYTGSVIYLAFYQYASGSTYWDFGIDDLRLEEIPLLPVLALTPTSKDFGAVAVGGFGSQVFTISNTGGADLNISTIAISGLYYTLTDNPAPLTLLPGQSDTFTVQYTPLVAGGPYAGNVQITDNRAVTNVALTGTAYVVPTLPITEGFETGWNGWTVVNGAQLNSWYVGTVVPHNGLQSAYISNDGGVSNVYDIATTSVVHFYKDVLFPTGSILNYDLNFWWKAQGESASYDYIQVFLADPSVTPVEGVRLTIGQVGVNYNLQGTTWQNAVISIPNTYAGQVKRLVFSWWNDSSIGTQPPAAVDDISLTAIYDVAERPDLPILISPATLATGVTLPVAYSWTRGIGGGNPSGYFLSVADDPERLFTVDALYNSPELATTSATPAVTYAYSTVYYWSVYAVNSNGTGDPALPYSFTTMADPTEPLPYTQNFGTDATPVWPLSWTQTGTSLIWDCTASANAGGVANEMTGTWVSGTFISRLITPPLSTTGITQLQVSFKQYYNDYGPGVTLKLQYSNNLVDWFDTSYSLIGGAGSVGPNDNSVMVSGLSGASPTYFAWTVDGNHYQINYWYVDNVLISQPLNWDAAPVSIDFPEVVQPVAFIPQATVINNGLNAATFDVTLEIGLWSDTQSVTLASGVSGPVLFASYTPTVYTGELVTVTTLLVGDENITNDVINGALLALPLSSTVYANNAFTGGGPSSFELATPGTLTDLDPLSDPFAYFLAGADWINGQWKGMEYNTAAPYNWDSVDTVTGAVTTLGTSTLGMTGVAYNANANIVYGLNYDSVTLANNLCTIDPITGASVVIGPLTGYGDGLVIGLAYDNTNDILYALDLGYDAVFTIDTTTLVMTPLGYTTGYDHNYAQSLVFDNNTGDLYVLAYAGTGFLGWVDTTPGTGGSVYKVGNFQGGAEMTGAAIAPSTAIEAPIISIAADGTISWTAVAGAASYNVYGGADPYAPLTLLGNTTGTSWLDPLFPEAYKFYYVTATDVARASQHYNVQMRNLESSRSNRVVRSQSRKPMVANPGTINK
jgi:hypothetical protein